MCNYFLGRQYGVSSNKKQYHIWQEVHFWIPIWNDWVWDFEEIISAAMLMKELLIKIGNRNNLYVHQWQNRISYSQKKKERGHKYGINIKW